jgi:hypothetical protein
MKYSVYRGPVNNLVYRAGYYFSPGPLSSRADSRPHRGVVLPGAEFKAKFPELVHHYPSGVELLETGPGVLEYFFPDADYLFPAFINTLFLKFSL